MKNNYIQLIQDEGTLVQDMQMLQPAYLTRF